jgi:hypothetical protein
MAWELLPVDYTDAVWSGLKRFNQIENQDGTVSFEDVTVYSQKEKSFFGARDANRMNEALNTLMSMVEQGTDLYEAFQIYFDTQKSLFQSASNQDLEAFEIYLDNLQATANADVGALKNKYTQEMNTFEAQQQALFTTWFDLIKGQLGTDVAGHLQNEIDELMAHVKNLAIKVHVIDTVGVQSTDSVVITNLTTGTIYRMTDFTKPLYLTEAGTYRLASSNENYFVAPAVMTIDHTDVMTSKQFRLIDGGGLAFVNGYVGSYVNHAN